MMATVRSWKSSHSPRRRSGVDTSRYGRGTRAEPAATSGFCMTEEATQDRGGRRASRLRWRLARDSVESRYNFMRHSHRMRRNAARTNKVMRTRFHPRNASALD